MRLMTAYGTEFFSMNDVNRLRILQDVIDRRLTTRLAATRLEISDRHAAGYSSAIVNTDRYRGLTADVVSLVTDS
jgi:hypothetical protein